MLSRKTPERVCFDRLVHFHESEVVCWHTNRNSPPFSIQHWKTLAVMLDFLLAEERRKKTNIWYVIENRHSRMLELLEKYKPTSFLCSMTATFHPLDSLLLFSVRPFSSFVSPSLQFPYLSKSPKCSWSSPWIHHRHFDRSAGKLRERCEVEV